MELSVLRVYVQRIRNKELTLTGLRFGGFGLDYWSGVERRTVGLVFPILYSLWMKRELMRIPVVDNGKCLVEWKRKSGLSLQDFVGGRGGLCVV